MTAQTTNRQPNDLGLPEVCFLKQPVGPLGANTPEPNGSTGITIYAGALCGYNTAGKVDNIDSSGLAIVTVAGVSRAYHSSLAGAPPGVTLTNIPLVKGAQSFLCDATVTGTLPWGSDLYAVDNQTLSADPGVGRIRAGFFEGMDPSNTANCICQVGQASPLATAPAGAATSATPNYARAVVTTIDAFDGTGTATITEHTAASGFGAQDGITLVVGDVVFIQAGTTNVTNAKDSGPWQVVTLGSASVKWSLTRPSWWQNGQTIPQSKKLDIGEGTVFAGTEWKTFCAKAKVIGTDDPTFYVGRFVEQAAFVAGDNGVHVYASSVGIRSATKSFVSVVPAGAVGGTATGIVSIAPEAITTPGYVNTTSMSFSALSTALAQNTQASTLTCQVLVCNW